MAKKKQSKPQQHQQLSPVRFLKERVRQVPVHKCYISENFANETEGTILVVRKHTGDKYTAGIYLLDKYCVGVKDADYNLRMNEFEYRDFVESFIAHFKPEECSYEEAHNWIWGAVAFAEEAGIEPCKEFDLAQYVLAEDNDEVELIEYDFGDADGKHCLLANGRLEASTYLPTMRKNLGDKFTFCLGPYDIVHTHEDWDFEYNCPTYDDSGVLDDDWDNDDDDEDDIDEVPYNQKHPEYPTELNLKNKDIANVLSCSDPKLKTDEDVDAFLSREGIREDLEQYILFVIGQSNDDAYSKDDTIYDTDDLYDYNLLQAITLLSEVGNEQSLDVILEVLRQSEDCLDYHFSDYLTEYAIEPAVAKLGVKHMDKLMAYAKESGLYDYAHNVVFKAVYAIWKFYPEMREQTVDWYKEVLAFAEEKLDAGDKNYFSRNLLGIVMNRCMYMCAKDLLPQIKRLYDKDYVDTTFNETYEEVEESILSHKSPRAYFIMDIHEWFKWYNKTF